MSDSRLRNRLRINVRTWNVASNGASWALADALRHSGKGRISS